MQNILEVLAFVHQQNIIHRDIKPSNLRRRKEDGKIVLIDFGAVKELGSLAMTTPGEMNVTQAIGTPGYMAAEQQNGNPQLNSDLYAVGIICIQALTGLHPRALPSDPNTGDIIWRYSTSDKPMITVSVPLENILNRMVRYLFRERYYSAVEALEDLQQMPPPGTSRSIRPRKKPLSPRQKWGLGLGIIAFLTGIWGVGKLLPQTCPLSISDDLSCGEEILTKSAPLPEKREGVKAFAKGKYDNAVAWLEKAREKEPNDPETLIYLNNARLAASNSPFYTIAVTVPLGNPADGGDSGKEILRGVAQVQMEINEGNKINGLGLRVLIADDYNNSERAQRIAYRLIEQPGILAVVGHYTSDNTRATLPIYTLGSMAVISPTSTAQTLAKESTNFFRTVPQDSINAEALAEYLYKQAKQEKVAVFYNPNSAYSRSLHERFLISFDSRGGQVVKQFDLSQSIFDAAAAIDKAEERGATGLVLFPDAKVNPYAFFNALKVIRSNQQKYFIAGGDSLYTTDILQERSLSENIVVTIPWHFLSGENQTFALKMRNLWKEDVTWRTATAYDATRALAVALTDRGNLSFMDSLRSLLDPQVRRIRLLQSLRQPYFEATGATGEISFEISGDRHESVVELVKVMPTACSPYGYMFVPIEYTSAKVAGITCN